jgi:hypothetical protein
MSSENRKKVLLGFGALAVILIVAIALWPPNFRKEDASGAIGEVQKHRAPQITQKDVVLGNESVRHRQKIRYQDFLADASKLKAIGSRPDQTQLNSFENELATRYLAEFTDALAMARANAREQNEITEVAELQSFIANHRTLGVLEMRDLNGKIGKLAEQEEASARTALSRFRLADEELSAVAQRVASARLDSELTDMANKLKVVEGELNAQSLFAVSLSDESDYLSQLADEADVVATRFSDEIQISARIEQLSDELMHRAHKNIGEEAQIESAMMAVLRDMDDQTVRASRINQASMVNSAAVYTRNLGAVSDALHRCESTFRGSASLAVVDQLAAFKELDTKLQSSALQHQLQDFEAEAASRKQ